MLPIIHTAERMMNAKKSYREVVGGEGEVMPLQPVQQVVVDPVSVYIANAGLNGDDEETAMKLLEDKLVRIFSLYGVVDHIDLVPYDDKHTGRPIFAAYIHFRMWFTKTESMKLYNDLVMGKRFRVDYEWNHIQRYYVCARNNTHKKTEEEKHEAMIAELDELAYNTEYELDCAVIENEIDSYMYDAMTEIAMIEEYLQYQYQYVAQLQFIQQYGIN